MNSLINATNLLRKTNTNTNTPQNIPSKKDLPSSSYEASITLVPKVDKAKKRNEKENYRSLLLMNIDITVFKKILLNQIQNTPKGSFRRMEKWLNSREHYLVLKRIQHLHSDSGLFLIPVPRHSMPSG